MIREERKRGGYDKGGEEERRDVIREERKSGGM